GRVVLGRGEQQRVGVGDRGPQDGDRVSAGSTSSSSEYGGMATSASATTTRAAGGASPAAARRSAVLSEPARRLPEIARTCMVSVGDEFEVDRQGDLPREHVAASRQLCLEVEAPVAAVDDGDE